MLVSRSNKPIQVKHKSVMPGVLDLKARKLAGVSHSAFTWSEHKMFIFNSFFPNKNMRKSWACVDAQLHLCILSFYYIYFILNLFILKAVLQLLFMLWLCIALWVFCNWKNLYININVFMMSEMIIFRCLCMYPIFSYLFLICRSVF